MSPNEKSARLSAIARALRTLQKEAVRLDEGALGFLIARAADEAKKAADHAVVRA
jgi:hypothetical protein